MVDLWLPIIVGLLAGQTVIALAILVYLKQGNERLHRAAWLLGEIANAIDPPMTVMKSGIEETVTPLGGWVPFRFSDEI